MSSCNNKNMAIPFLAIAGAAQGLQGSLAARKQEQVSLGTKTFTQPKTKLGKFFGEISGRTQAFESQQLNQQQAMQNIPFASSAMQARQAPISGGFSFGGEARKRNWLPFALIAGLVAIFYSMRNRKGGRRRR